MRSRSIESIKLLVFGMEAGLIDLLKTMKKSKIIANQSRRFSYEEKVEEGNVDSI